MTDEVTLPTTTIRGSADAPQGVGATSSASFFAQLKPASYRGVPFFVLGGNASFGRRNALHEYPFRDTPWVEDLGRQSRRIQLTGFLVGDDVIAQRERLIAACEKPGDGILIHGTLGQLTVALMTVSTSEHWERGRYFEINFSFVEQGQRLFPADSVSSVDAIANAADATADAAAGQWNTNLTAQIAQGASIAPPVAGAATTWAGSGVTAVNSATGLMNIATSLQGSYGRLLGQASGIAINAPTQVSDTTLQDLVGDAAAKRSSVGVAAAALTSASAGITAAGLDAFVALARGLAVAVRVASFTPADALQSMTAMATVGGASGAAGLSTADLFRRVAVCELANACGAYQPSTTEEAVAVRSQVLGSIDAEITTAGDQGDDTVYAAMRALRAQTILDMNAKGANLPTLITVKTSTPIPSLVLAQRLYRDPGRDDEVVRRGNPIHPAFMPLSFLALSS